MDPKEEKKEEVKRTPSPSLADLSNPDFKLTEEEEKEKEAEIKEPEKPSEEKEKEKETEDKKKEAEVEAEGEKSKEPIEEETEVEDAPETFWKDVKDLSGEELDIDFGDVDPISPQGAFIFAKAFREKGIEEFEKNLEAKLPREYQALQMASEGLDPSVLYKTPEAVDYNKVKLDKEDASQHKQLIQTLYEGKGLGINVIKDLIDTYESKGTLGDNASEALKELRKIQADNVALEQAKTDKIIAAQKAAKTNIINKVTDIVNKGDLNGFNIPEKERNEFANNFLGHIRIIEGQAFLIKPLKDEDFAQQMQSEFLNYKKGNLQDIVVRKAITETTKKLRLKSDKSADKNLDKGIGGRKISPALSEM